MRIRGARIAGVVFGVVGAIAGSSAAFAQEVPDAILDRMVVPATEVTERLFRRLRVLQQGQIQVYVLYILIAVAVTCIAAYLA